VSLVLPGAVGAVQRGLQLSDFPVQTSGSYTVIAWGRLGVLNQTNNTLMRVRPALTSNGSTTLSMSNDNARMITNFHNGTLWLGSTNATTTDGQFQYSINTWYPLALQVTVTTDTIPQHTAKVIALHTTPFAETPTGSGGIEATAAGTWHEYLTIGYNDGSTAFTFYGNVAEVSIWSGILTEAQLLDATLYYASSVATKHAITTQLKGYWPLLSSSASDGTYDGGTLTEVGTPTYNAGVHPTLSTYTPTTKKLKVLVHPDAASAAGVDGIVFTAPTGDTLADAEIGEFTDQTFLSSGALEDGQAVLKVVQDDIDGTLPTVGTTVAVSLRNADFYTGIIPASIIEE
jgi:hypothetical protein